jgi:6-phosphogluconolactonase
LNVSAPSAQLNVSAPSALRLPATVQQHLFATAELTARALAQAVAAKLRDGLQQRRRASLIVPGGRTPEPFLNQLAMQELPWSSVIVSLSDDRLVAADHADSNEGTLRRHLLQGAAEWAQLIPLVKPALDAGELLGAAERALATMPRPVDATVVGMGEDGHTASLFPGAAGTAEALDTGRPQRVALIRPAEAPHPRISLTLRALLDTRAVMILIHGERKRGAIERAADSEPTHHPIAALVQQAVVPVHLYYSP